MYNKIEHKKELNNKLLFQFQDKEIINIVNDAIGIQLNDIEDTLEDMTTKRGLNSAIGKQLNVIGINKNIPRNIDNDEIYRQEIKNKIAVDSSKGFCNDLIFSAKVILNGGNFLYKESYPARCEIYVISNKCNIIQFNYIKNTVSLGVGFGLRYSTSQKPFGYNSNLYSGFKSVFDNNSKKGGGYASIIGDNENE